MEKFGTPDTSLAAIGVFLYYNPGDPNDSSISVPFLKRLFLDLGWFYIPFVVIVIVGSSNAVNLTDGLDGLAMGSSVSQPRPMQ